MLKKVFAVFVSVVLLVNILLANESGVGADIEIS